MKKRLALIVLSLDKCFPKNGFSGGEFRVTQNLISELVKSNLYDIDIFCVQNCCFSEKIDGINSVTVIHNPDFLPELKQALKEKNYDYILSSDTLLPFANNLVHSNSSKYKSKNGKNKLLQFILKFYNHSKIKAQNAMICHNHAVFAVSERLRQDYIKNFDLDENKAFTTYPIGYVEKEFIQPQKNKDFTIGAIGGGGLNKGGYLLVLALAKMPKTSRIKARIIYQKFYKRHMLELLVKFLKLENKVEIIPQQKDMTEYFKTIDCYVLPSLNEALGLVVPESALNYKPSIVSSTTGACELIKEGENGFIFDREHSPIKNLTSALVKAENIYFNDFDKYVEISKNANKTFQNFSWETFTKIIIENMVEEKHEL